MNKCTIVNLSAVVSLLKQSETRLLLKQKETGSDLNMKLKAPWGLFQ